MMDKISSRVRKSAPGSRKEQILSMLLRKMETASGIPGDQIDVTANLFQMGLDSLMLTRLSGSIKKVFHVEIRMKQFYEETDTIDKLVGLIHEKIPEDALQITETPPDTPPGKATTPDRTPRGGTPADEASDSVLERVMARQLDLMSRQLELLRNAPRAVREKAGKKPSVPRPARTKEKRKPAVSTGDRLAHDAVDFRAIKLVEDKLSVDQLRFIEQFVSRYTRRTRKSKELIKAYRPVFSDWINSLGFRLSLKELMYPIYANRSEGSRLWDVDGNEYIDIAMGYGVNYLGHRPPFVTEAVEKQLREGYHLGPQFNLTNEVAALLCELTGVERVAFCNTGSEAVMTAMRLARTVTGRDVIAFFEGSYHGNFDGILAIPTERGPSPMAPGTPDNAVADVMILKYGADESLETIRNHGRNLAAVLVEPVQTRNPSFRPREFLKRVREITRESGIALIFDEIVTGFRLAQGGAQAFYNIQADIVTYGKLVGGGIPASVVAGKAAYLDAIDGGPWDYGGTSVPEKGVTFFAGTFAKHPLAMAAMHAVLTHLKTEGPKLQEKVNARTSHFAAVLNAFFEQENVSARIRHCASFFIFESFGEFEPQMQSITMDLMFYLLMEKGVYTWERRICYFSTVHTDEDVNDIIRAVKESVAELRAGGFSFAPKTGSRNDADPTAPASSVQRRMYALSQFEGGDVAYHVVGATWIDGRIDAERLEDCFRQLIQRHDSLRTRFVTLGDTIRRQVLQDVDFRMIHLELTEDRVETFLKEVIEPFDLSRPPLLRVWLARVSEERCLLIFDAHHIAADGLSTNILVRELMYLYEHQNPPWAPGRYGDYVRWEQNYMASEQFENDEAFWLDCFPDAPPVLDLATDYPRPPEQSFAGGNVWFKTDMRMTNALKEAAREKGASLFMVLLAGYYVLLHRLTGREDIVVGIPTAGREGGAFEYTVGMFVNTLAIRERPGADDAFTDFLESLKRSLLNGYDHQNYPFEALVEKLNLKRDVSHNPIFDVMFAFENADERVLRVSDLTFTPYDFKPDASMADLTLEAVEAEGEITLRFEYCAALFKRETIERWSLYYVNILQTIIETPDARLFEIDFLPASEKRKLLVEWNDTGASYPADVGIHHLFEKQAGKNPNHIAAVFKDARLTYEKLNQGANRVAHYLQARGVAADEIIAIMTDRSPLMFFAILGILKAGGAYLPVNPDLPEKRIRFMLRDSACKVLLTEAKYRDRVSTPGLEVVDLSSVVEAGETSNPPSATRPGDLAYVLYTSGSTGEPKGCLITHENVVRLLINDRHPFDFNAADIWTMAHSYTFDFSVWEMYGAFLYGGTLIVPNFEQVRDAAKFLSLIKQHRVTVLNQTPGAFYNLIKEELKSPDRRLHEHLRWVIFGGDRLEPPHLATWFHRYSPDDIALANMYGITETTVHVTFQRLSANDARASEVISPIGAPIPETNVYLLDDHLGLTPIGAPGEMYVGGTGVCRGYLNRPDLTRERFVDNPFHPGETLYRSGDLARRLADGRLLYLGRNDNQVQIRGYRVEPGEVETHLLGHPGVEKAVVAAKTVKNGSHRELVAYIVGTGASIEGEVGNSLNVADLRRWLSRRLPDYMAPAHFVLMDDFPLTENAKIDRKALPDPLEREASALDRGVAYQAPVTDIEKKLGAAWEATLGKKKIGLADNFFDLGGDSIKAIQIVSRLNRENLVVETPDIFRCPTIRELAKKAVRRERQAEQGVVSGDAPLTALQSWFFKAHGARGSHFTQAVLLRAQNRLDEPALRAVFEKILAHHDALRMRCRFEGEGVVLENLKRPLPGSFETVDLTGVEDPEAQLKTRCARIPERIDLTAGPLMKAVLFRMDRGDRLLIVIHHLVVDGVSWRILIEDVNEAYARRLSGKIIHLPPKTDPFILWAGKIHEYANSETLLKEKPYWQSVESVQIRPLPMDSEPETNRIEDEKTLTLELNPRDSERLLTSANRAYHTEINDILLTALARAMKGWHGENRTLIAIEGHGREPLFETLDVSRTVGWFTSLHPFLLELPDSDDPGRQIRHVKESLRQTPNRGVGWSVLKYITAPEFKTDLPFRLDPRIIFNYLGRFDEETGKGPLEITTEPVENTMGPDLERNCDIEIEGVVLGGRLRTSIIFNPGAFCEETMETLLGAYHDELQAVIEHCASRKTSERTPSDLTYEKMSVDNLDDLLAREKIHKGDLEDVYPLSPMQEGMLFHTVHEKDATAYFEQFCFPVYGDFHVDAFEKSWNELIRRHEILRTAFVHKGADRPLQIVLRERRIDFKLEDLSALDEEVRSDRRRRFKREDRQRMFDPARDVLLRIGVLKLGENTHEIIWSHHHLLMDGWCMGIIFQELFEIYAAVKQGVRIRLKPPTPYREYIKWLENTDQTAAKSYWKQRLAGYGRLATLPKARHGQAPAGALTPAVLNYELPAGAVRDLERLAAENRVTVNTVIQSVWAVLLCKYNNVDDVVFGSVVSGRPENLPGVENMVGLFLNTIPVRIVMDGEQTLMDLIRKTQQVFLDGQAHHHCSLADIQAASNLKQGLLDHVVVFENYPLSDELHGIEEKIETGFSTGPVEEFGRTNYDFSLEVYHRKTILFKMKYNARVYDKTVMARIRKGLALTLEAVIAEPGLRLRDTRRMLMTGEERKEHEDFINTTLEIDEDF